MKFSCLPPFIVKTGKFKLSRSLSATSKDDKTNFPNSRASYKPIGRFEQQGTNTNEPTVLLPPTTEEESVVGTPTTFKKEISNPEIIEPMPSKPEENPQKLCQNETEKEIPRDSASKEPKESDDNFDVLTVPNKKKEGVSGHSSGISKPEKASDIQLPRYEKNEESEELIKEAIRSNEFLKEGLFACKDVIQAVVDAMYLESVPENTYVIGEGEVGSHMYVCAEGTIEVYKGTKKVNTLGPGRLFGELAILYNSKRNATILATTACKFWVLDRKVFQQIMKKSGMQMTENKVKFLRSVPLLSNLDTEVLIRMTDLLKLRSYPAGSVIIRQGDEGSLFYIITGGTVSVTITQSDGKVIQGKTMKAGDFFGEKALLKNVKRAATLVAEEPGVECLTLDRVHFIEYLGDLQELHDVAINRKPDVEETKDSEFDHIQLADLEVEGTLGIGAFGRVELVRLKEDKHTIFALKRVKKIDVVELGQQEHMLNEKKNMMLCQNPFTIRLYNTYKSNKYLYFLMEACLGGDVWSLLQKRRFFDEALARFTTACMVEAFDYLHARGIAYRDLKPENVLYDAKGYAKLADFGFSKKIEPATKTWTFAGTPEYVAPEIILNEGHDRAVDYWTLGIFVHELLVGRPPFRGNNHSRTYTLILKGIDSVSFPRHVNKTAQLLIKKLCRRIPAERLGNQREGVTGIKKHKWFQNFDWHSLEKTTMKAPYIPKLIGPTDMSHFDKYVEDKEIPPDEFGDWDVDF